MDKYIEDNRAMWDELTDINARSTFYDMEGFKRGRCSLDEIDVAEVGEVAGKTLLHLQCHFGQDTLSWARRGATVTGADLSPKAIELARGLAGELGIDARFLCHNVYDLPERLEGEFDVVYTSAGVLCWLPDLVRWARVAARYVRPGGVFYLREFHPVEGIFDDAASASEPRVRYPYFHSPEPIDFGEDEDAVGPYADPDAEMTESGHEWSHPLGEVVTCLIEAGLRIEFLHEFPFTTYPSHPFLTRGRDGRFRYLAAPDSIPMMYSLRATRP